MSVFKIIGGNPISGILTPQGNKNEALPVLCACLMNSNKLIISNVPEIKDITNLIKLLEVIGAKVTPTHKNTLEIETLDIKVKDLPLDLATAIRGSVTLLGPLLARVGEIFLPKPGGDKIGRRRIDTHLEALAKLGAEVQIYSYGYKIIAKRLKGTSILLDEASVTGTENVIMAATVAEGITTIYNAACEPHVQGLCSFLQKQGVEIHGIGSNFLTIHGLGSWEKLQVAEHNIQPDYIEIGSFVALAATTKGSICIRNVNKHDLQMIEYIFGKLGVIFSYTIEDDASTSLIISSRQSLIMKTDIHEQISKIEDATWPGFPADLISIAITLALNSKGTILFHEKMFESRLYFTDKLISMGAKIVLCDPHRAIIVGPSALHGATLSSPDIRAGMALLIAAATAQGESFIQNAIQIDRGYQNIVTRLQALGVNIERLPETEKE